MPISATGALVGRLDECRALTTWTQAVATGERSLLVVRGEAGIGKSTLLDRLATTGTQPPVRVLRGGGVDDSPLPYGALAAVLRRLVEEPAVDRAAADVIRDALAARAIGPLADPDDPRRQQSQLHRAVAAAFRRLVADAPLLLVVDDAHWIDDASAALLGHLAATLTDTPVDGFGIGIALATRPLDPSKPLYRLVHGTGTVAIDLDGLAPLVVGQLVRRRWGWRVPASTAARLCDVVAGNPLSLISTVESGLRSGVLAVSGDELVIARTAGLVAVDIDADVGDRLAELDDVARRFVELAAVFGNDAPVDELAACAEVALSPTQLDAAVETLAATGLLVDHGDQVAFTHPRVRAAVLHQLTPRARTRLHARIADAQSDVVLAAHHSELAGNLIDPARLAALTAEAGAVCAARFNWGEAARFFGAAVDATAADGRTPDGDLFYQLALAEYYAYDSDRSIAHAEQAAAALRAGGDVEGWGRAAILATRVALVRRPHASVGRPLDWSTLRAWLDVVDDELPAMQARAYAQIAQLHTTEGDTDAGTHALAAARRLADVAGDDDLASTVAFSAGLHAIGELDVDGARAAFGRASERAVADERRFSAAVRLALVDLVTGHPSRSRRELEVATRPAARAGYVAERSLASAVAASASAAQCRLDEVDAHGHECLERYAQSGYAYSPLLAFPALAAGQAMAGDLDGALAVLDQWETERRTPHERWRWLVASTAGDPDELDHVAAAISGRSTLAGRTSGRSLNGAWVTGCQAELAVIHQRVDLAADVIDDLRWLDDRGVVVLPGWPFFVPRLVAAVEAMAGDPAAAARRFDRAEVVARHARLPAEPHRITFDRDRTGGDVTPEALGEAALALDLLGLAALVPATYRRPDGPGGVRIVAFCDLVSSTALNVAVGDVRFAELIDELTATVRRGLRATGGVEFKHTGDGIAAWFRSAVAAVHWAVGANEELDRITRAHPDEPLRLCVGLAAGEPVDRSGDLFGVSVVLAARLCAAAAPGEVLVSDDVRNIAATHGLTFRNAGARVFKGFPDPMPTHAVVTGTDP